MVVMFRELVTRRLRVDAASPLVTCYGSSASHDLADRSEFSTRSFVNWVDKTANLLIDELDADTGDTLALPVLEQHPHHWMAWVWMATAWQVGLQIVEDSADITVHGPELPEQTSGTTLACSLHPLGLPLDAATAARAADLGVIDYSAEVLSQPDAWLGVDPSADTPLWGELTWDDLVAEPDAERRLIRPESGRDAASALIAALPRGSVVTVPSGTDVDDLTRIRTTEKAR